MKNLEKILTVVIPVKNEEANLAGCLENVKAFEHVVVVDSGSEDRTVEIAAQFGRKVVQFKWNGRYPKKRNWVLGNYAFKTPWVMFLDADERMTRAWVIEATRSLNDDKAPDVFTCFYDNWFMGRMLKHGDVMRKTAVMRVGRAAYEWIDENGWSNLDMEIHEHLQPSAVGSEGVILARMEHHDYRSLESYHVKHEEYANWEANRYRQLKTTPEMIAKLTPRQKKKYDNITKWWLAPAYFCVCYFLKCGFLDGKSGFVFAFNKFRYFRKIRRKILCMR